MKNNPIKKRTESLKTFLQRRHTDDHQTHEKMLNITNHQRKTNRNHEIPILSEGYHQKEQITSVVEDMEKRKLGSPLLGKEINAATMETVWRVPKKLRIELRYYPAILLLGIYIQRKQKH